MYVKKNYKREIADFFTLEFIKQLSNEFHTSYDRWSLADYLRVERSAMSTELSKLCKDEIIECYENGV